ncbi:hypothetical protein NNJEOMEG_02245 [Fundidesulfovibrio magnetotacticus]|uniref:Uncharacterized protein n=1 Tax=Fundidesulfovibrio magnetotacticus TaxID=2730080 RepID=A0A6V8LUZ3_9BACT|nr:hypothetical protein NNJEOMEG_02245 [Fundidesulfovibrio magnetotacticus]
MMAMPMGIIITVVAVLETHMEMNAAATMKPRMMREGLVPTIWMVFMAMR